MISYNRPYFDRLIVVTTCTLMVYTSVIKHSKHILFSDIYRSKTKLVKTAVSQIFTEL